jgi:hypothetical protein
VRKEHITDCKPAINIRDVDFIGVFLRYQDVLSMQLFSRWAAVVLHWSAALDLRGKRCPNHHQIQKDAPNTPSVCTRSHIASRSMLDRSSGQCSTEQITIGGFLPGE